MREMTPNVWNTAMLLKSNRRCFSCTRCSVGVLNGRDSPAPRTEVSKEAKKKCQPMPDGYCATRVRQVPQLVRSRCEPVQGIIFPLRLASPASCYPPGGAVVSCPARVEHSLCNRVCQNPSLLAQYVVCPFAALGRICEAAHADGQRRLFEGQGSARWRCRYVTATSARLQMTFSYSLSRATFHLGPCPL